MRYPKILARQQCGERNTSTSGGDRLLILFELGEVKAGRTEPIVYNVFLKGPARIIYAGELRSEALL
ncbi:hypothetical protein [Candidatus Electronema sp. JM]|uniref:hypothetical protein n=1 Tax=Candidatus Electronema sp. JM TaxID=3401571 RepID=UPI003AA99B63